MKKVKATYLFPNNMIVTFDNNGKQMPDLQGEYSTELHEKIIEKSDNNTEWCGMTNFIIHKPILINELNMFD